MNPGAVPGWYPDPLLRADFRYWDGYWTPVVSDGTTASTDARPLPPGLRGPSTYAAPVVRRAGPPPLAPPAERGNSPWWYAAGAVLGALAVAGWLAPPNREHGRDRVRLTTTVTVSPKGTTIAAGVSRTGDAAQAGASHCVASVLDQHDDRLAAAREAKGTTRGKPSAPTATRPTPTSAGP